MNIHQQIKVHLDQGDIVYSFALGRVGQIIAVDDHPFAPVTIKPNYKNYTCATTFTVGDKVKLVEKEDAEGKPIWAVVNTEWPT